MKFALALNVCKWIMNDEKITYSSRFPYRMNYTIQL